jgi:hypothetical protein
MSAAFIELLCCLEVGALVALIAEGHSNDASLTS